MHEPGGDGVGVVPINARPANGATTSPSRRSPSVAVLSSSSPVGITSAPAAPCLHSGRGVPLSPSDGITAMDGVVGASAAAAVTAGASMYTRDRTVSAAMLGDEELDMFDIELQRDFQSKVLPSAVPPALGAHTATATSSPPMAGLAGQFFPGSSSSNGRISTSAATTGMRLNTLYSPWNANVAFENGNANSSSNSKQFASMADMCQTANFLERRDDAQRLVHRMASAIRKEMHVALDHGVLVTVTGTGGGGSTTATNNNNNNASTTAAPGEARSQADTPVLAPLSSATPRSFETDIQLVNFVISEVNRRYGNAAPSPSSPRVLGAAAVAAAGLGQSAVPATTATATPNVPTMAMSNVGASTKASAAASKNYTSRAAVAAAPSPTGLMRGQSQSTTQPHLHRSSALSAQALYAQQMQARREYTSGRSTIDTEVNDSLGRIYTSSERSVLPHHSHFQPSAPVAITFPQLHELVQRPGNPCPASTGVTAGSASHTHARTSATATAHPGTHPTELLRVALLHNKDPATMSARFGGSSATAKSAVVGPSRAVSSAGYEAHTAHHGGWGTRSNQSTATTARSESGVQCPRAVKPPTTTSSVFTKTSGPRNRTGKNIVPSDRSAFSECSGGETRSSFHSQMNSTFRHNHSSSTCRTTDTSLSGAIPVVVSKSGPGVNSGAGGRPMVMAAAGPGNTQSGKEELHAAS